MTNEERDAIEAAGQAAAGLTTGLAVVRADQLRTVLALAERAVAAERRAEEAARWRAVLVDIARIKQIDAIGEDIVDLPGIVESRFERAERRAGQNESDALGLRAHCTAAWAYAEQHGFAVVGPDVFTQIRQETDRQRERAETAIRERDEARRERQAVFDNLTRAVQQRDAARSALAGATDLLRSIARTHLREPDSDYHERCNGCGNSPYNVPQHKDDCLAPKLRSFLGALSNTPGLTPPTESGTGEGSLAAAFRVATSPPLSLTESTPSDTPEAPGEYERAVREWWRKWESSGVDYDVLDAIEARVRLTEQRGAKG